MSDSGKRGKGRLNSSSQQPNYNRKKEQQLRNSNRSSVGQHDDGHKHQKPRPRHSTYTHSDNPTAPSVSTIRTSDDARRDVNASQPTVLNAIIIKEEEDETEVRTQAKYKSAGYGMDSKQSHAEKHLKMEVDEDGNNEQQRIKIEQCDDDQNNKQNAADKPTSSSSLSHRLQSRSSPLNKTDHTLGHAESTTKFSSSDQTHRKQYTRTSIDQLNKKSKRNRKRSKKNKEKDKYSSDERHEDLHKTSNSNSASETTALISTDDDAKMCENNSFSVGPHQNQECDSLDIPISRRYSTMDEKNDDSIYKQRSHSHSGCFREHHESDDNASELALCYDENNDANNRKRRRSSIGSQESRNSPSLIESDDGYHLFEKCPKIQNIKSGHEVIMDSPLRNEPIANNSPYVDYIKNESSDEDEPVHNLSGNGIFAPSHSLEQENGESEDEYIYLHGFDQHGQACMSYCNVDPTTIPTINSEQEVYTIGYVTALEKINFGEYGYSNANAYLEEGSAGNRTSNNAAGFMNANDDNYYYDNDNKQTYTQQHDGDEEGFQLSSESSPYNKKTELENSEEDIQNSADHLNMQKHEIRSYDMMLNNANLDETQLSEDSKQNTVPIDTTQQTGHMIDLDDDTSSSNSDEHEVLDSSMTKDSDADLSTSGNYSTLQNSPDWPKPSPNLSEFLRRMNKPISPRSSENESRPYITDSLELTGNLTEEEYTRRFYEGLRLEYGSKRRYSISSVWEHNRSPDDLSLNEQNVHTTPLPAESPFTLAKNRVERRRSTPGSIQSFATYMSSIQLAGESATMRHMSLYNPRTSTNEGKAINDDADSSPILLVRPSERYRSPDDNEPRSGIAPDHTEHSYMDENVNTKLDTSIPSTPNTAIGEGSGVFVAPEVSSPIKKTSKRRKSMPGSGQIGKNRQQQLLSAKDDFFKKPFEYGWRRELVWRSNLDSTSKADVYFISPSGKKLRSRTDIAPLLEGDLTVDHFCFIREPQDVDPKYELVRNAKSSRRASTVIPPSVEFPALGGGAAGNMASTSSTIVMGKRISKPKAPKGASPPPEGWTAVRALRSNNAALTQRSSTSASGGSNSARASSVLQINNNNLNNNSSSHNNNTSNSNTIIKPDFKSINDIPQTTITNGLITNSKEKSAVTAIPQPQPQPQQIQPQLQTDLINDLINTIQKVKALSVKPSETSANKLEGSIAVPVTGVVAMADNTNKISESKRKDDEIQALLASIDCIKCQSRMKGKLLSDNSAVPVRRCQQCLKRMNNILNVKILSTEDALANAANIKSSQEIIVVNSKKYISLDKPKEEKVKPIELSTTTPPRFQKLYDTLSQLTRKQRQNSSKFVDAATNTTTPLNFSPRVVASDTAISITENEASTNVDAITSATDIDSNSTKIDATVNDLPTPNNYLANVAQGYEAILCLMKHLMLPERALLAKTCKLFNAAYNDCSIWQSVNLRNTYIVDWEKFSNVLQRHNTRVLDMRKVIQKSGHQRNEMWRTFLQNIGSVKSLETLILPRCPSRVVESVLEYSQDLRSLTAFSISDERISLPNLNNFKLRELRLHSSDASDLIGNLESIPMHLKELTSLSLTNIQNLHNKNIASLLLQRLETLELGDCSNINATDLVTVLHGIQLKRLRLEFGMSRETSNNFSVTTLLNGLQELQNLKQLELINVDIKPGFDTELSKCIHLKKLLIIPTYILQSATTNQIIMNAVQQMSHGQLVAFTWGFTIELLRVTALYNDKSKARKKRYGSIPILRPVPGDVHDKLKYSQNMSSTNSAGEHISSAEQHVAIVPVKKVENIVRHALPHTKFSTVKVYFGNTWKQQLLE